MSVLGGGTRCSCVPRKPAVAAVSWIVLAALVGCGGGEGVAAGATVTVYVSVPLHGDRAAAGRAACAAAQRRAGPVGDVRVRVVCLDDTGGGERWTLAAVGANARRATEDSSTIAYIGEPDPAAARFSQPILEEAGIAQLSNSSGATTMARLLQAIRAASGSESLREAVNSSLGAG